MYILNDILNLHRNIILKFNVGRRLRKLVGWSAVRVVLVLIGATIILVVISVLVVSTLAASSSVSSVSPIISTPTTAASRVKSWSGRSLSKGVNVQHFFFLPSHIGISFSRSGDGVEKRRFFIIKLLIRFILLVNS
ncbi:EC1118_1P2_4621p [Saccharomyces cerevisiae EC1118]|uniref:EC1118_1P2_4621p n=1 Tax=Saccharomyces cerevisiae (strain Lalvin EC1118 / Prise de mousse) TaxID=643680 RepID=C8ZJF2_YEAS8|nr:EC1118_1P2_4621p [Saccharomyces cerevisiae EC1118]